MTNLNVSLLTQDEKRFLCHALNNHATQCAYANDDSLSYFRAEYVIEMLDTNLYLFNESAVALAQSIIEKINLKIA